ADHAFIDRSVPAGDYRHDQSLDPTSHILCLHQPIYVLQRKRHFRCSRDRTRCVPGSDHLCN
ncbi:unnamed protein product, partial [Mycena citricolor]